MAATQTIPQLLDEISEFLASSPSAEQVLGFHPSKKIQQRARILLRKQSEGRLTDEEKREMNEFLNVEILMGLVKAKLRAKKTGRK